MKPLTIKCPMCGNDIRQWHYVYSTRKLPTIVTYRLNVLGEQEELKRMNHIGMAKTGDHCPLCFGVVPFGTLERMFKEELIRRIEVMLEITEDSPYTREYPKKAIRE